MSILCLWTLSKICFILEGLRFLPQNGVEMGFLLVYVVLDTAAHERVVCFLDFKKKIGFELMLTKRSYRCFDSAGGPNRPGACERQKLMTAIWMALSVLKEKMFQPHPLLQPFWAAPHGSWLRWGHPVSSPAILLLWRGLLVIFSPLPGGQQPCQPLPSSLPHTKCIQNWR